MPSRDHFKFELRSQMQEAIKRGAERINVNAAELHQAVGGYPGAGARMDYCCEAMIAEMKLGDEIMAGAKEGGNLRIVYYLTASRIASFPHCVQHKSGS